MDIKAVEAHYFTPIVENHGSPYPSVSVLSVIEHAWLAEDPCIPDLWYSFNGAPYEREFDLVKFPEAPKDKKEFVAMASWALCQQVRHFCIEKTKKVKCKLPDHAEATIFGKVMPPLIRTTDQELSFQVAFDNGVWSTERIGGSVGLY